MDTAKPAFGVLLAETLEKAGMSKADLACAADVPASLIGYYVRGRSVPRLRHLAKLAQALDLKGEARRRFYAAAGHREPTTAGDALNRLRQLFGDTTTSRALIQAAATQLVEELRVALTRGNSAGKVAACLAGVMRTLDRFDRAGESQVRWAIIPVAGWQAAFLSPKVTSRLVSAAIREATQSGLTHFVVVVAPTQQPFLARELGSVAHAHVRFVVQKEPLGFGNAVWVAREELAERVPVAVLTADELVAPTCLRQMLATYAQDKVSVVAVRERRDHNEQVYGLVSLTHVKGDQGRVKKIVEKPQSPGADLTWILVGRYVLSPECLAAISGTAPNPLTGKIELTDAFQILLKRRIRVQAHLYQGELESLSSPMREVRKILNSVEGVDDRTPPAGGVG